jgi:hypothetical protein
MPKIIDIDELKQENKELKSRWSKLKKIIMSMNSFRDWQAESCFSNRVLDKMNELEKEKASAKD